MEKARHCVYDVLFIALIRPAWRLKFQQLDTCKRLIKQNESLLITTKSKSAFKQHNNHPVEVLNSSKLTTISPSSCLLLLKLPTEDFQFPTAFQLSLLIRAKSRGSLVSMGHLR